MITKELFLKIIRKIQDGDKRVERASDALNSLTDGYAIINIHSDYEDALLELFATAMKDDDNIIEWWLYENVEKKIWLQPNSKYNDSDEEIEIDVSIPELLYDFLIKYPNI